MLRFLFVGGYALFIILVIVLMALKVISVVDDGWMGKSTQAISAVLFTAQNMAISAVVISSSFVAWLIALVVIAKRSPEWERAWVKTLIIGCTFMSGFFLVLSVVGASVFLLDGLAGEVAAKIAGYMSSPVFMELGFFCIGLTLLFSFNIVRRIFEGDEFVELEIPNHILEQTSKKSS
jgi:uncharacterized membrane protein YozB (DUF420 family)